VIEERLREAKAVVVIWSAEAAKSERVRSEADRARGAQQGPPPTNVRVER
jgi:adenylate cyclase